MPLDKISSQRHQINNSNYNFTRNRPSGGYVGMLAHGRMMSHGLQRRTYNVASTEGSPSFTAPTPINEDGYEITPRSKTPEIAGGVGALLLLGMVGGLAIRRYYNNKGSHNLPQAATAAGFPRETRVGQGGGEAV